MEVLSIKQTLEKHEKLIEKQNKIIEDLSQQLSTLIVKKQRNKNIENYNISLFIYSILEMIGIVSLFNYFISKTSVSSSSASSTVSDSNQANTININTTMNIETNSLPTSSTSLLQALSQSNNSLNHSTKSITSLYSDYDDSILYDANNPATYETGFEANLNLQQQNALNELKNILKNSEYSNDIENHPNGDRFLLKFLRATMKDKNGRRIFNVKACKERIFNTLEWRREYNCDTIRDQITNGIEPFPDLIEKYQKIRPMYRMNNSLTNRITVIEKFGLLMSNVKVDSFTENQWIQLFIRETELGLLENRYKSIQSNTEISTVDTIVDCAGMNLFSFMKRMNFLKLVNTVAGAHYPELVEHIYIVNAPSVFSTVFNVAKKFLDPTLASKINVLNGKEQIKKLRNDFDLDKLPKEYGGNYDKNVMFCITAPGGKKQTLNEDCIIQLKDIVKSFSNTTITNECKTEKMIHETINQDENEPA